MVWCINNNNNDKHGLSRNTQLLVVYYAQEANMINVCVQYVVKMIIYISP